MPDRWIAGADGMPAIMISVPSNCSPCWDHCTSIALIMSAGIAVKARVRATGNWMWKASPVRPVCGA